MIIVQPDGRLALWSSVVDALVVWDATDDELVDYFAEEAARWSRESSRRRIERARAGLVDPRTLTYEQAVAETLRRFGDDPVTRERFGGGS